MPESEPSGVSPDAAFGIAWTVNQFEAVALDPKSLAAAIAEAAAWVNDESLENTQRVAFGSIWYSLRSRHLGASPAEVDSDSSSCWLYSTKIRTPARSLEGERMRSRMYPTSTKRHHYEVSSDFEKYALLLISRDGQ